MSQLKITVQVEVDGLPIRGFPWVRRITVDKVQSFLYTQPTGGGYIATPSNQIATMTFLALRPSKAMTLRLQNQSDAGLPISADGLALIVDSALNSGVTTNAKLDNSSGATATIDGLAAGA